MKKKKGKKIDASFKKTFSCVRGGFDTPAPAHRKKKKNRGKKGSLSSEI